MDATQECKGYIILIEWDGQKPPTRWYTQLTRYGLKISGDKGTSPLTRRAGSRGVVFQEGTIIVNSDSLARTLASDAREMGAMTVMIGNVEAKSFQMSEQDKRTLETITAVTSRRGPKSKLEEGRYVIHCFEEAKTHVADLREQPVVCPECGSIRIQWWRGEARKVAAYQPETCSLIDYWIATRFDENGRYEIPLSYSNSKMPKTPAVKKLDPAGAQIELAIEFSETLTIEGKAIIRAMDVAYNLQQLPDEVRLTRRINALREYYGGGGSVNYPMAVDLLKIDMVDIAGSDAAFIKYL